MIRRRVLTGAVVVGVAAGLWLGAASCNKGGANMRTTAPDRSVGQGPLFPSDMGPDTIDVTSYPVAQQENYALFVEKCSLCHSLARSINSVIVDASTWERFVRRMHGKNKARSGGPLLGGDEAKRIIAFLAFDARERKIKHAEEFQAIQADLQQKFERALRDQAKQKTSEDRIAPRESVPYVGDK